MKNIVYILFLLALAGCNDKKRPDGNSHSRQSEKTPVADTIVAKQKADNAKFYTKKDTLIITFENEDILKYTKGEFNEIIDKHPEFVQVINQSPTDLNDFSDGRFSSQAGEDEYCMLYAYFLKQQNGIAKYAVRRNKLIDIFSKLNWISWNVYGGTGHGHTYRRIPGYAEYAIYLYKENGGNVNDAKKYNFAKQKRLFSKSLQQFIDDGIEKEFYYYLEERKIKLNKEMNAIVNDVNKLITDRFYLEQAQKFENGGFKAAEWQ